MTDSRAALEEAAAKFWQEKDIARTARGNILPITTLLADFYEQESYSLKLLLRAICKGVAGIEWTESAYMEPGQVGIVVKYVHFPVELDSSGIPVLTPEILEALKNV